MNPLKELERRGQAVWLDFITRGWLKDGSLDRLIAADGLRGVTSNPTIFQKAIQSADYDGAIQELSRQGLAAPQIFETIAVEDIQSACEATVATWVTCPRKTRPGKESTRTWADWPSAISRCSWL